jgi:AraC-like DNA-binding protein
MDSVTPPEALQHEELDIAPPLRPYVVRRMRTWASEPIEFEMPLPPSGSMFITHVFGDPMTLAFTPGEEQRAPEIFIGGQLRRTMPVSRASGMLGITGFEFTPTGFHRLFHVDCQAFTDAARPLDDAVDTAPLRRTLADAAGVEDRMTALQDWLLGFVEQAAPATAIDDAVARVEREHGGVTVGDLADFCHLGERQLNRRFLSEVGVGPKHFAKIVQLKQALMTLQHGNEGELQSLAQRNGYFDQAHFINDFQRLIGTNPLAFLQAGDSFMRTYMKHHAG